MNKKLFLKTFGCQMNDRDSEAIAGLFLEKGYALVESPEEADVILVNTCSVRDHAENRAISFLGSLKKLHEIRRTKDEGDVPRPSDSDVTSEERTSLVPRRVIGLIGCMARNRGEELLQKMPHLDLVCGPAQCAKIPEYVEKIQTEGVRLINIEDEERDEVLYHPLFRAVEGQAQIVISTGCSNFCSYCVVPYVRGPLRLREPQDIIDEVKRNLELGIKKITLLGQNVNDYLCRSPGHKVTRSPVTFVDLLKMVAEIEGVEEIDFITSHPKNTSRDLFSLMREYKNIKKHLHLPFQSGSNRILELMNRGYTKEEYFSLIKDYKNIVKGTLSTDIIVGFPTEKEEDFLHTKDVMEEVRFRFAYIFKYSPRSDTGAFQREDDVPEEEKKRRHRMLLDLQKEINKEHYAG